VLTTTGLLEAGHALDVRQGDAGRDAVDGLVPSLVIEPRTVEAVAATLAWASNNKLSVLLEGGGTKRSWGRVPERLDVNVCLRQLDRVLDHRQGDLTVSVEAGLTLRRLNEALALRGQQLPLDPPYADRATIGGLLATNDSGPARHRFGTPRDLVIGVQLATTNGRLAKAGGQVVKNVAGYDLSKLISGSFGTLAAIVSATFKVSPLPAASKTLVIEGLRADELVRVVDDISKSQLEPVAFEIHVRRDAREPGSEIRCLVRFASLPEVVDEQVRDAAALVGASGVSCRMVAEDAEARLWQAHSISGDVTATGAAIVRASWLPANLGGVLALLDEVGSRVGIAMTGRAAVGAGSIRIAGVATQQAAAITRLRQSEVVGNVVVTSATTELKAMVDVWGQRDASQLFLTLKRALDPNGTLGAGRSSW
jgi:glycolate oxidase FAD binding subunit